MTQGFNPTPAEKPSLPDLSRFRNRLQGGSTCGGKGVQEL